MPRNGSFRKKVYLYSNLRRQQDKKDAQHTQKMNEKIEEALLEDQKRREQSGSKKNE